MTSANSAVRAHITAQRLVGRVCGQMVGQRQCHQCPFVEFSAVNVTRSAVTSTRCRSGTSSHRVGRRRARWPAPRRRRGADRQSVAPGGREKSGSVGRQDVQSSIRVVGAHLGDRLSQRIQSTAEDECGEKCAVAGGFGGGTGGQHAAVDDAVVRQQPLPVGEGCGRAGLDRHAGRRRPHRRDHAVAAQRRCDGGERGVPPQRRGAAPPPRRRAVEKADAPAVGVHQAVFLPPRRIGLHP